MDLNSRDVSGWTPLHYCAYLGGESRLRIMKVLLEEDGNIRAVTALNRTPLHLACMPINPPSSSKSLMVSLLIASGGKIDARDSKGYTPMLYAAKGGDPSTVYCIVHGGCNLYAITPQMQNCLHLAILHKHKEIMRFLCEKDCEAGVLKTQKDSWGKKAIDYCYDQDSRGLTENLWEASAKGDVAELKRIMFSRLKEVKGLGRGNITWPAAGLDDKTAGGGYTPMHMMVLGCWNRIRKGEKTFKRYAQVAEFLIANDAFVDALDKECR